MTIIRFSQRPLVSRLATALTTIVFVLLTLATVSPLTAQPISLKAFGHEIEITGKYPDSKLIVDGRQLHTDGIISIEEVVTVGDLGVIIGHSSGGGNVCEGSHFVISFPPGEPARFDGPLDTCHVVTYSIQGATITFEEAPTPNSGGALFSWGLANGFTKLGEKSFSVDVDDDKGWAELRRRDVEHPSDLLSYGQIAAQINALLGTHRREYEELIFGVGSGEFRGDTYIGRTCAPHNCGDYEALLVADMRNRRIFLAWKTRDNAIEVRPKLSEWGDFDQGAFSAWQRNLNP